LSIFEVSHYFDLTNFSHNEVFKKSVQVWDTLKFIEEYLNTIVDLEKNVIEGDVSKDAYLIGNGIFIERGAKVDPGVYIAGPAFIGEGTHVRHGAYLRGKVLAGKKCVIGHTTEVKNSIFMDGAKAGHFAYVGDSILGNNVNLGAGTKLANLKVVTGNVHIKYDGKNIDTGLRKFGAILGDDVQTGCNSVMNPGFIMAKAGLVYPCVAARGIHPEKKIIKD